MDYLGKDQRKVKKDEDDEKKEKEIKGRSVNHIVHITVAVWNTVRIAVHITQLTGS